MGALLLALLIWVPGAGPPTTDTGTTAGLAATAIHQGAIPGSDYWACLVQGHLLDGSDCIIAFDRGEGIP
jgi:hypothetical protein